MTEGRLTGGRVSYYLAPVKHPQREEQPAYVAECEDIIQALQMDFNEACEFKAIWRTAAARLGNGKEGNKALYDAEKRLHYAGRSVRELRQAHKDAEPKTEASEWFLNQGVCPELMGQDVQVVLNDGSTTTGDPLSFHWAVGGNANGTIKKFRYI